MLVFEIKKVYFVWFSDTKFGLTIFFLQLDEHNSLKIVPSGHDLL